MKQTAIQQKKCPECARFMVSINLDVRGEQQTLRSCSHCDLRIWETQEGTTTLDVVLDSLAQGETA